MEIWRENAGCSTKCVVFFLLDSQLAFPLSLYLALALWLHPSPWHARRDAVCHFHLASDTTHNLSSMLVHHLMVTYLFPRHIWCINDFLDSIISALEQENQHWSLIRFRNKFLLVLSLHFCGLMPADTTTLINALYPCFVR